MMVGGLHLYQEKYFFPEVEITQEHHPKTWSQLAPSLATQVFESSVLMVAFPAKTQLSLRETSQRGSQIWSIILILKLYVILDEYFAVQQCLPPLSTHLAIGQRVQCTHLRAHIPTTKCCNIQLSESSFAFCPTQGLSKIAPSHSENHLHFFLACFLTSKSFQRCFCPLGRKPVHMQLLWTHYTCKGFATSV